MSYKQTLVINQSQRLVLTPQLRQRIEMLQMTQLELSELVSQQLAENPVLEELPPDEVAVSLDSENIDFTETAGGSLNGTAENPATQLSGADSFDGADQSYSNNYSAGEAGEGGDVDSGYDPSSSPAEFVQASSEVVSEAGREGEVGETR